MQEDFTWDGIKS